MNTTKCQIQHQCEKWHCGLNDHSSINHPIAAITSDLVISPEQGRSLAKGRMTYLADQFLGVEYDTKNPILITDGSTSDNIRNHSTARGWITSDTFLPHMQRAKLEVRMSTVKILSDTAQVLLGAREELGCETTSLDLFAYIWDYLDNFVLWVFQTEEVNLWNKKTKYHIFSGPDSTTTFVFEVKNNPQKPCVRPIDIYPTNYGSLYVAISWGGFDLRSGRNLGKERNDATQLLYNIAPTGNKPNSMHKIWTTLPTKQVMKTGIWICAMKCRW